MHATKLYDIKRAARRLGVATSTLRYWESEGLVRVDRNHDNDYRQYTMHDIIYASEIAFYRKLGMPVKELRNYRTMSLGTLDEALERTEKDTERRIEELETMKARLAHQRALNDRAKDLRASGMRPGFPEVKTLSDMDYDNESIWKLLVNEPWHYGVLIEADSPGRVLETVADAPTHTADVLWRRTECTTLEKAQECLLRVDPDSNLTNARELFVEATRKGLEPTLIVGSYLLTASENTGSFRWDYYRAWVL